MATTQRLVAEFMLGTSRQTKNHKDPMMSKRTPHRLDADTSAWRRRTEEMRRPVCHPPQPAADATPGKSRAGSLKTSRTPGPANCLFNNQIGDRIVGVVRLVKVGPGTARILLFRVDPEWYHTAVVTGLLQSVWDHCRQHGCFRVLIDFSVAPPWMSNILRGHGFRVRWRRRAWEATLTGSPTGTTLHPWPNLARPLRGPLSLGRAN